MTTSAILQGLTVHKSVYASSPSDGQTELADVILWSHTLYDYLDLPFIFQFLYLASLQAFSLVATRANQFHQSEVHYS